MKRRGFLQTVGAGAVLTPWHRSWPLYGASTPGAHPQAAIVEASAVGQPVNLFPYGEVQSWINPLATPALQRWFAGKRSALGLAEVPWQGNEFDLGVEWPEQRLIEKIVVRFSGAPADRSQLGLERWEGMTALQGEWKPVQGGPQEDWQDTLWTIQFPAVRSCRVRLKIRAQKQLAIDSFEISGPSKWKSGEVRVEWGYLNGDASYDGKLESYNGEILDIQPLAGTQLAGPRTWTSAAGNGKVAGIRVTTLYTSGTDVDRSILTLRTKAGSFSFLPGEAIEQEPIDIPDLGVFICSTSVPMDRTTFRQRNAKRFRLMDAVAKLPEQTLENAYAHIDADRVIAFAGVDSNCHKFGIGPNGHIIVGYENPSFGRAMVPRYALYFETVASPTFFQAPTETPGALFKKSINKDQELTHGWMPIITTKWSNKSDIEFERTDYAVLADGRAAFDESQLNGDEPAVLISRFTIRNTSPLTKTIDYYLKPWKPRNGNRTYDPVPDMNLDSGWQTSLSTDCVLVFEDGQTYAVCYMDTHGRGTLEASAELGAVRYSVTVGPEEEHTIHAVIPGEPIAATEVGKLKGLAYDNLYHETVQYWEGRQSEGMQAELPDPHLQNLFNANLQHFLVSLTKDPKRGEYYPNTALFAYGTIGTESGPIIIALDMRGMHKLAEKCLRPFLSTQGDSRPWANYPGKEGGFYHYWPWYTSNQGFVLWALAEHYLYTRDKEWLTRVAPQIVAGCDFLIRARKETMKPRWDGSRPLTYGLAPAGTIGDPQSWNYSFMLNGFFYLGMKKCAQVLEDVDPENARRIAADAADFLQMIRRALKEITILSPVVRLRDNSSVPCSPPFATLRGFASDIKGTVDPDPRFAYASDCLVGALQLVKCEVMGANDPETTWLLNELEDRYFMFSPHLHERVRLDNISRDWFDLGGFDKMQPFYLHYPEAYLLRDQIPNFLRALFNTTAVIADPQNLSFQEEIGGGQPQKTHEEARFVMQVRHMLIIEIGSELHLARGTPRSWLDDGKQIAITNAPSYFGEVSYRIKSFAGQGRIEAAVSLPRRDPPGAIYLRLRHPQSATLKKVTLEGRDWKDFDSAKEWIKLPVRGGEIKVVALY